MRALHDVFVIPTMNFWTSVENNAPKLFFGVCKPARLCAYNLTFIPSGEWCWNISLVNLLMSCVVGGDDRRCCCGTWRKQCIHEPNRSSWRGSTCPTSLPGIWQHHKRVFSGGKNKQLLRFVMLQLKQRGDQMSNVSVCRCRKWWAGDSARRRTWRHAQCLFAWWCCVRSVRQSC